MTTTLSGRPLHLSQHVLTGALLLALPGLVAAATDVKLEVGTSVRHSDNIALREDDPTTETVLSPDVRFEAEKSGSVLQIIARGGVEYQHFLGGEFDSELRGNFVGHLEWTPVSERFKFVIEDYLSYQPVDVLTADRPDNFQQLNSFVAGPSFYFQPAAGTQANIDLRYLRNDAEETPEFDSQRGLVAAQLVRELSAVSRVAVNANSSSTRFEQSDGYPDYTRHEGYLSYGQNLRSLDLAFDVGQSWMNLDDGSSHTSPLARVVIDWRLSARSEINARLSHEFSDAVGEMMLRAADFSTPAANFGQSADNSIVVAPDVYRQRYYGLTYKHAGDRVQFSAEPWYEDNRYIVNTDLNNELRGGRIDIGYRFATSTSLAFNFSRVDRKYSNLFRDDEDVSGSIGIVHELSRHWTVRSDLIHRKRDTNAAGQNYDESSVYVRLAYRR